ncbi:MmgE/PrpD family protein [Specibacter sp. RAF43]|uniref:MmgE/PrpD family protein n=1 Tax=Specibacter sp. RAF43 TaxID=3233057 RepID=UPI003F98CD5E
MNQLTSDALSEMEQQAAELVGVSRAAVKVEIADIPSFWREQAVAMIADTIGVMLSGGSSAEVSALAADEDFGTLGVSHGGAQLVTPGRARTDVLTAAFINATAGAVTEMDEFYTDGGSGGHPAVHIVPAALAVAQARGQSGRELLAAVVAGYEVAARLFRSYSCDPLVQPHGHMASVGAAVAVSRLLGRDPATPALIAAAMPMLTLWEPSFEGASVHYTYTGVGATVGILANKLATAGFSGSQRALSIAYGEIMGSATGLGLSDPPINPDVPIFRNAYAKFYSCCGRAYPAVEAALSLSGVDPSTIKSIEVETDELGLSIARQPEAGALSRRFSTQYAVAAAIVHGHAMPSAFAPDERTMALSRKVVVHATPEFASSSGVGDRAARVTVTDLHGRKTARATEGHGAIQAPWPLDRLRAKFTDLSPGRSPERSGEHFDLLMKLESLDDLSSILSG